MKLLSWNICAGGGAERRPLQLAAIKARKPDLVALQELTQGSVAAYRNGLAEAGLVYAVDSFALAPSLRSLVGPRRYGQMIASRWPLKAMSPDTFKIPWPERLLSAHVNVPTLGRVDLHNTHVPPGSSNGWTKIRHLEGIYARLAVLSRVPRILVGDFNTPKDEHPDGTVVTWGTVAGGDRWDVGERRILEGLAQHDLPDAFRTLHGYRKRAFSIVVRGTRRRYDHVLASRELQPTKAEYLHNCRKAGMSDHAPLLIVLTPRERSLLAKNRKSA